MRTNWIILLLAFVLATCLRPVAAEQVEWKLPPYQVHTFPNGFQLIVVENHSSPLVSTVIVVKAGLRNETSENNGVSHMLEHMTFNGTESRTQKQLYDEIDFYGLYINANTSTDFTSYLGLGHRDTFAKQVEILADMLFHSTFPETNFQKEKGIIVEEVGKDSDNPDYQRELQFLRTFYKGTPYQMPVLGTVETIRNMNRDQVVEYYRTYYQPANMIAMIVGDMQVDSTIAIFGRYFLQQTTGKVPPRPVALKRNYPFDYAIQTEDKNLIYLVFPAPVLYNFWYIPFKVFYEYAFSEDNSVLLERLRKNRTLGIRKIKVDYDLHPDFSNLIFRIETDPAVNVHDVKRAVISEMQDLLHQDMDAETLGRLKNKISLSEIMEREEVMYYGFLKAGELALGGSNVLFKQIPAVLQLSAHSLNAFLKRYTRLWNHPQQLAAYFDWTNSVNLEPFTARETGSRRAGSTLFRRLLSNGLTVIHLQNADNPVAAFHLLFKNRAAWEPDSLTGIVDCLHRMLFYQTAHYSREALQQRMQEIGARVKAYDWDFIPYDDYYNVPEYSYIRFETLDQFLEPALEIIAENLLSPVFTVEHLESVRRQMKSIILRKQQSASEQAQQGFLRMVLGREHPYSRPVNGTEESMQNIGVEQLEAFYPRYFSAGNIVLSVVSGMENDRLMQLLETYLGPLPAAPEQPPVPQIPITEGVARDSLMLGKQQASFRWGYTFSLSPHSLAALQVMNGLLNDTLTFNLREIRGWAYRMGTAVHFYGQTGLFTAYMGTAPENLFPALSEMRRLIGDFRSAPIAARKLTRIKNKLAAQQVRRQATRQNQAFLMGLYEFQQQNPHFLMDYFKQIKQVSVDDILRIRQEYLQNEKYCLFYVK